MSDYTALQKPLLESLGSTRDKLLGSDGKTTIQLVRPASSGVARTAVAGAPAAALAASPAAALAADLFFADRQVTDDGVRMLNALAALAVHLDEKELPSTYHDLFVKIGALTELIDAKVKQYLDHILHDCGEDGQPTQGEFRTLEANWRGLAELSSKLTTDEVIIDFLDVTKAELSDDLKDNDLDIFGGQLFQRVYTDEYDSYGGRPFATMIGLFDFNSGDDDVEWLHCMTKICAAAHCPFIASVNQGFFHKESMHEVAALSDLDAVMNHPKMAKWNALRDEDWAAYIGLTLPRYIVRLPWEGEPAASSALPDRRSDDDKLHNSIGYSELGAEDQANDATRSSKFLWGNAAFLFAQNVVRSYENSGWAQHIRGPVGGGLVEAMTAYCFTGADGKEALEPPVEITIPDFREYQFARNGLISLVNKKNEPAATFFSATSIKRPKNFLEDMNTKNAYLVTNLSYTFSIGIIAHYIKVNMREYIGSTADAPYIQQSLSNWLGSFVTTVNNPDDMTLAWYPFKSTSVDVEPKPGPFGWYKATVSILPWQQFEGMDVELRLEAQLGAKAG